MEFRVENPAPPNSGRILVPLEHEADEIMDCRSSRENEPSVSEAFAVLKSVVNGDINGIHSFNGDIDTKYRGYSGLVWAVWAGEISSVEVLLGKKANPNISGSGSVQVEMTMILNLN